MIRALDLLWDWLNLERAQADKQGPAGPGPDQASKLSPLSSDLLRRLVLRQAATMARAGQHPEAASLIEQLPPEERARPDALDLLARIQAQQGNLHEAEELWTLALQVAPSDRPSQLGLHRIDELRHRPYLSMPSVRVGIVVVTSALLISGGYLALWRPTTAPHVDTPAEFKLTVNNPPTYTPPKIRTLGTSLRREETDTIVTFESGLFKKGSRLKPAAEETLASLARELRPQAGSISVTIAGCTDDKRLRRGSRYASDTSLRLARATVVMQKLLEGAPLQESMFSLQSSSIAPYPNTSAENRAKNRTVILRISPANNKVQSSR